MTKLITALSTSAATLILAVAPAFAGQTSPLSRFMIADMGRDTVSLSSSRETLPAVVKFVPVENPQFQRDLGYGKTTAIVKIELTATGKLASSSVSKSTGNRILDQDAIRGQQLEVCSGIDRRLAGCRRLRRPCRFRQPKLSHSID